MRSTLGSDYESSDEEREDVTRPKKTETKNFGFQDIEDQQSQMVEILKDISKPVTVDEPEVKIWLDQSHATNRKLPQVPHNTPAQPQEGMSP